MIREVKPEQVQVLFDNWKETLIWSCLDQTMGHLYANDKKSAMAIIGDFCFFAGEPDLELVTYKPEWCTQDFIIMVPKTEAWGNLIEEAYGNKANKVTRYATKKEEAVFDIPALEKIVSSLDSAYVIKRIDKEIFDLCKKEKWSRDLVSQYETFDCYEKLGLGVAIMKDGIVVSGASSYTRYQKGIEIEIDTKEEYRRKGLASVCGAKLILECLERNLYPSWDAQNEGSLQLSQKLGYHFAYEYTAYEVEYDGK